MLTVERATELILTLPEWKQSMVVLLLGRWELAITTGNKDDFYMPKLGGGSDADILACLLASDPVKDNWQEIRAKL